jgi:hypothetical protein
MCRRGFVPTASSRIFADFTAVKAVRGHTNLSVQRLFNEEKIKSHKMSKREQQNCSPSVLKPIPVIPQVFRSRPATCR